MGRVLSITKVEVHEPPKPKDSQPFRGFEKPNPVVINLSSVGGERRHGDLRHPRNPRRGPCQSPVLGPQEQVRSTLQNRPRSHFSGRTVRIRVPSPKPSSRVFHKTQGSRLRRLGQGEISLSRPGRAYRASYVFVFGHPPRADVGNPVDRMEERAHLCECSSCRNISYSLSARSMEAFLSKQLLRTEGFFQDSSTRPGTFEGSFRLWLEWSHSSLCYKGHLVGIGSIQIHHCKGNVGNDILRSLHEIHPGWQACGFPYGQRGRFFLCKRNGFASLTSKDGPGQAVSVFVHEVCHYLQGPSYSRFIKCPCGRRVKGQTQCHRQLPGPRNFIILFRSGRLTFKCNDRLMCYQGKYEVQPICLSRHRQQPKVCGMGCQVNGLSSFPASLSFPPSSYVRTVSSQNLEDFRDGSISSPLLKWPCFGSINFRSKVKAATSRFLFPSPEDRREDGRKKEVLRLLDVGILDIPIPSSPEQPALVSLSPPNTPIASSLVSGSSSPAQLSHAAVAIAKSSKSLASVRRFRFKKLGFSRGTRKVLKRQYSSRTINQYNGAWLRFSAFVSKKKLPKAKVKESTVLNYLSSRLKDPAKPEKGKVAPLMLRTVVWPPKPVVG